MLSNQFHIDNHVQALTQTVYETIAIDTRCLTQKAVRAIDSNHACKCPRMQPHARPANLRPVPDLTTQLLHMHAGV